MKPQGLCASPSNAMGCVRVVLTPKNTVLMGCPPLKASAQEQHKADCWHAAQASAADLGSSQPQLRAHFAWRDYELLLLIWQLQSKAPWAWLGQQLMC